jgi:hypothetical protein
MSVLANFASWLLKDAITREVEDRVKLDVKAGLETLKLEVNRRYTSLTVAPATIKPRLDDVKFLGVRLGDDILVAGFDLSGVIDCDILIPNVK